MNGEQGSSSAPMPRSGAAAELPSYGQLVGVWARAARTLWGLALDWWKLLPETAYPEDPKQRSWSTTVYFRRRDRDISLDWWLTTARGEAVPGTDVFVTPTHVTRDDGQGAQLLEVSVTHPPHLDRYDFELTIRARDDPLMCEHYSLGFGVPGAGA